MDNIIYKDKLKQLKISKLDTYYPQQNIYNNSYLGLVLDNNNLLIGFYFPYSKNNSFFKLYTPKELPNLQSLYEKIPVVKNLTKDDINNLNNIISNSKIIPKQDYKQFLNYIHEKSEKCDFDYFFNPNEQKCVPIHKNIKLSYNDLLKLLDELHENNEKSTKQYLQEIENLTNNYNILSYNKEQLQQTNSELQQTNSELQQSNSQLQQSNSQLQDDIKLLSNTISLTNKNVEKTNKELLKCKNDYVSHINMYKTENTKLKSETNSFYKSQEHIFNNLVIHLNNKLENWKKIIFNYLNKNDNKSNELKDIIINDNHNNINFIKNINIASNLKKRLLEINKYIFIEQLNYVGYLQNNSQSGGGQIADSSNNIIHNIINCHEKNFIISGTFPLKKYNPIFQRNNDLIKNNKIINNFQKYGNEVSCKNYFQTFSENNYKILLNMLLRYYNFLKKLETKSKTEHSNKALITFIESILQSINIKTTNINEMKYNFYFLIHNNFIFSIINDFLQLQNQKIIITNNTNSQYINLDENTSTILLNSSNESQLKHVELNNKNNLISIFSSDSIFNYIDKITKLYTSDILILFLSLDKNNLKLPKDILKNCDNYQILIDNYDIDDKNYNFKLNISKSNTENNSHIFIQKYKFPNSISDSENRNLYVINLYDYFINVNKDILHSDFIEDIEEKKKQIMNIIKNKFITSFNNFCNENFLKIIILDLSHKENNSQKNFELLQTFNLI